MQTYRSRFSRIQEEKSGKKLFVSVALTIIILLALFAWGIPLLINMSSFISGFNRARETPTPTPASLLFAPTLESSFEATNSTPIRLTGYSNTEGKIELYLNGDLYDTVSSSSDGTFVFSQVILKDGPNKLWVDANVNDQKSENSEPISIFYSKDKPKIEITSPDDGATINTEIKSVIVAGTTDEGNTVTVNDHFVVVDLEGKFAYTLPLNDGDNALKILATDKAGNQTIIERTVKYSAP